MCTIPSNIKDSQIDDNVNITIKKIVFYFT